MSPRKGETGPPILNTRFQNKCLESLVEPCNYLKQSKDRAS